ncbi:MAG: hypothetical protein LUC44_06570 [Prevotellaceae bacterium]|nr:hypothetical protein [Prevotellaceae bacterium]
MRKNLPLHLLPLFGCLAMCVGILAACGGKAGKEEELPMFNEADTAAVVQLTEEYLDLVKDGQYDRAISMLHDILNDSVRELPQEREAHIREQQRMFPVLSYERTDMQFFNPHKVRVTYSVKFFEKEPGSDIPNTVSLTFEPQRIDGEWYLELSDRSHSR